tara:strand:+ start:407 stop:670 length:264 start_codon:yes stop_codon:yes gene_type:complete
MNNIEKIARLLYSGDLTRTEIKNKSIDELEFSVRTHNCLQCKGIRTIGELADTTAYELLKTRNFGNKSLSEVAGRLEVLTLYLREGK